MFFFRFQSAWKDNYLIVNQDHSKLSTFDWKDPKYEALHDEARKSLIFVKKKLCWLELFRGKIQYSKIKMFLCDIFNYQRNDDLYFLNI